LKWKVLLFVFFLATVATSIGITATSILTLSSNSINSFDLSSLALDGDGNATTTGGGDPLPGGGIPT